MEGQVVAMHPDDVTLMVACPLLTLVPVVILAYHHEAELSSKGAGAEPQRPRPNFGTSMLVAIAWLLALEAALVLAEVAHPRVAAILVTDGGHVIPRDTAIQALFYAVPVTFVAAVISALVLRWVTRRAHSPLIAGSVAAALPVLAVLIGYAWLIRPERSVACGQRVELEGVRPWSSRVDRGRTSASALRLPSRGWPR